MRLTLRTDLAARVLMFCAANDGAMVRSADIAAHCNASVHHLLQVVSLLQTHGFVTTSRGRTGGLRRAQPMARISIGQLFRIFEAGLPFAECFDEASNTCPLIGHCRLRPALGRALEAFYRELDQLNLADLVSDNCGLTALLSLGDRLKGGCSKTGTDPRPAGPQ